jgi:hypothetical protein
MVHGACGQQMWAGFECAASPGPASTWRELPGLGIGTGKTQCCIESSAALQRHTRRMPIEGQTRTLGLWRSSQIVACYMRIHNACLQQRLYVSEFWLAKGLSVQTRAACPSAQSLKSLVCKRLWEARTRAVKRTASRTSRICAKNKPKMQADERARGSSRVWRVRDEYAASRYRERGTNECKGVQDT